MSATTGLIPIVAVIIGIGVLAQVLSDRFQVPSVLFLIVAGVVLGPEILGFVTRESFGNALPAIVGLSVAIIIFEGAFHIDFDELRQARSATLQLITVGALIALLGTAAAVHFVIGSPWPISLLIGSLLVATGPTVITPILDVVPVRDRVAAAMETEGVVNDVTAAILAVVLFEAVVDQELEPLPFVESFVTRLGVGVFVGLVVAVALWYLLNHVDMSSDNAPGNARLLTVAAALLAFGGAETVASEAGIAAVATAGMVLGNVDIPYEEAIGEFKSGIMLLVLSFIFIALAALLEFEDVVALGLPGLEVVFLVVVLIRPLLVFLSTWRAPFSRAEKLFMSSVAPRGIIPASVATLFAIELEAGGFDQRANVLVGMVFLVILATVVVEGGFARHIAEYLDVIPMRVIIVGGGKVGRALAERLENRGENVVIVEQDRSVLERTRDEGYNVHEGDGSNTDVLRSAGADNAKIVVAATGDDDVNLLVAQLAGSKFDAETIIARANNPDNVDAFEDLGVRTISSSLATAWAMDNIIERPALSNWMTELGRGGEVQEVEVTAEAVIGRSIDDLDAEIPAGCIVALVSRDGEAQVPDTSFVVERGDHVTFLGRSDAVWDAIDRFRAGS